MKRLSQGFGAIAFGLMLAVVGAPAQALEAPERALVRAALEATVEDYGAVDAEVERIVAQIDGIVDRLGTGKPTYKRARRLHQLLHRQYLKIYDRDADTISRILDDGSFNCLSASLLYGTIARSLGYRTHALSEPGHLLIRLGWGDREIDVETTLLSGFDARRTAAHGVQRGKWQSDGSVGLAAEVGTSDDAALSMPLESAVGFAWLNRSWHDLDRDAPVDAAFGVRRALGTLPPAADQIDGARLLLARAFSVEYDAGRFDNAFEIANVDAGLFPERTTARDRLVAAAVKRIELRCESDAPDRALDVIDTVKKTLDPAPEFVRLELRTYPAIAAAAVRLSDWTLALEISDRYSVVQPDPVESKRLAEWVETRRAPRNPPTATAGDRPPRPALLTRRHRGPLIPIKSRMRRR